jgi:archaellum component FlaC
MTAKQLQLVNPKHIGPEEKNITHRNKISGGGDDGGMNDNERIARLEVKVDNIENTLQEIKLDIRDLRGDITGVRNTLGNEISSVRDTLGNEISSVRDTLGNEISSVRDTLNNKIDANFKWIIGILATSGLSVITSAIGIAVHFIK